MAKERIGVYPGSFDPITYGHVDVVERSLFFFDRVIVAVARNPEKHHLFALNERVALIRSVLAKKRQVTVDTFDGLLVDYLKNKGVPRIIRGLRAVSDFEYEFQMALTNRKMNPAVDTVFLMPGEEFFFISSSLVKEIARLKGNVSMFVPRAVEEALRRKFQE